MRDILIEPYREPLFSDVVSLLGNAYSTNPINVALFGGSGERERKLNRAMFEVTLKHVLPGEKLVARWRKQVVGFVQYARSPRCRPRREEIATVIPLLGGAIGDALPRVGEWLRAWGQRDPEDVHWHLGTIAVRPDMQGQGIGSLLMGPYCARLDESRELGYLETDRAENTSFYRKSGFAVTGELEVLGVPTWFMRRAPTT